jgi:hypothetical protein
MPSMKCHECLEVKKCSMYLDNDGRMVYLCSKDAKLLGYKGDKS